MGSTYAAKDLLIYKVKSFALVITLQTGPFVWSCRVRIGGQTGDNKSENDVKNVNDESRLAPEGVELRWVLKFLPFINPLLIGY